MTRDEVEQSIIFIQNHLTVASNEFALLYRNRAWELLGITETQFAQRIFGPLLKPNTAYKRFWRAIRAAEMRQELAEQVAAESGQNVHIDAASLSPAVCEQLYQIETAGRLEVVKTARAASDNGRITARQIEQAAEAVAEYGAYRSLPDGAGGQVAAHEVMGDLLWKQAQTERRIMSSRVYVAANCEAKCFADEIGFYVAAITIPDEIYAKWIDGDVKLKASIWYEDESAAHDR